MGKGLILRATFALRECRGWLLFALAVVTRTTNSTHKRTMAKPLTKSQITATIADEIGITKKQATETLELLASLAYKNAKSTFTLPGIGKLVLVNRKARTGRNPATGETIQIPAKRVVKFRVAKACKDAVLGAK
jgi:DNA-binding protein HU-beta